MAATMKSLLTVKCIAPKMIDQIRFADYDWNDGSLFKSIWHTLLAQNGSVVGWVPATMVPKARKSLGTLWLVKIKSDLFWWSPPEKGPIFDLYSPTVEQLFVA
jgi:hypothetical protein